MISILCNGSTGDIQPYIPLAIEYALSDKIIFQARDLGEKIAKERSLQDAATIIVSLDASE